VSGIEVFVRTLVERLQQLGHHAVVITAAAAAWHGAEPDRVGDIPVYRFAESTIKPRLLTHRFQYLQTVERAVRKERLDVVECCDESGLLWSKRFGCPLIVRMHQNGSVRLRMMGLRPEPVGDFFVRRLLRIADLRVGVSDWVARMTLDTVGLNDLDYRVVYNGVDTSVFTPTNTRADADLILYVGQLNDRKGLDTLFAAIPAVMRQHPAARLRCVGANRAESGLPPPSEKYMSMIPSSLRSRVDFAGEVARERMPEEFRRAGLCVFPSRAEGHPIAVLEAMACGAPVVFMRDGVGPEVIADRVDGLLCDTRDPAVLASTMSEALSSPGLRSGLGKRARQKVELKFSLDKTTDENVAMYEEMVRSE